MTRRSIYKNLLLSMLGFGVLVGTVFPLFAKAALQTDRALSTSFFLMCVLAGVLVGGLNYLLFYLVVSRQISTLLNGIKNIIQKSRTTVLSNECENYQIKIESDDSIGKLAEYFNEMSLSVCQRIQLETFVKMLVSRLSGTIEIKETAKILLETVMNLTHADMGVFYGLQEDKFIKLFSIGIDNENDKLPESISDSYGAVHRTLYENTIIEFAISESGFSWMNCSLPIGTLQPERIRIIPFAVDSRIVALAILSCPAQPVSDVNRQLLEAVRNHTAAHVSNALLHEKIRMLAALDDLTQLLNRRFGMKRLHEEFSRSLRHGIPLSLVMVDIDHFKRVNDNFGHDAGDEVIKFIARNLEKGLRVSDVVCRYGGEEFLIIATGAGLHDAGKIAERIRMNIEKSGIRFQDKELHVTISAGVAAWPVIKASQGAELISEADKALYFAKEHGRNQVVLADGENFRKYE